MALFHLSVTQTKRSAGQSAIASAAYRAGERLYSEYYGEYSDYTRKGGVICSDILLPSHAPPEYADRQTLWNAVEKAERGKNAQLAYSFDIWNAAEAVEKQWNSQLARRWVLTIPREIPPDQYAVLVREFCEQQFVSKGMIADFAIHDPHPPGRNPHAHVMLTMRTMDEHGKWLPKSRKVYDLDENGERIKLPSGRWKSHKEDTVDWNDHMIAGRISEQNFNTMLEKTQTEQTELKTKVSEGRKRLSDEVQLANDAKQWVEAIQEYANITELDAATLNRLIKEIVVHERIDEDKTRHISIEIHFNLKPIPEVEQVTA